MKRLFAASAVLGILVTIVTYKSAPKVMPAQTAVALSDSDLNATVKTYCAGCHSDALKTGNLSLQGFDVAAADKHAETAEKMIRKLRAGFMPPPGAKRPDADTQLALVERLETVIDKAAALNPNPG